MLLNQILLTDCIEGMRSLPSGCIPLTVTSPPYDNLRTYGDHPFHFEAIAEEMFRVTMPGGIVVWIVAEQILKREGESSSSSMQRLYFKKIGFRLHQTMVMERTGSRWPSRVRYGSPLEYAFILSKGWPRAIHLIRDKRNRHAGRVKRFTRRTREGRIEPAGKGKPVAPWGVRGAIWRYSVGGIQTTRDREVFNHPALMPEQIAEDHIISWSHPGDLVFDPMCGAATTCQMALLNNRYYLGMEIHKPYWDIAQARMRSAHKEHKSRLDMFFMRNYR